MTNTDKQTQPEGTRMVDLIDLAETIEDGVVCLTALAHADRDTFLDREYYNAIDYLAGKLRDDITTLRANLTYRAATEQGGTIAIIEHAKQKQKQ